MYRIYTYMWKCWNDVIYYIQYIKLNRELLGYSLLTGKKMCRDALQLEHKRAPGA